jgi:putative ATPase
VLFVDEIHRWNKAQQDALLPHVESGRITLIGATTENPSFSLNPALQSRLRIFRLEPLGADELVALLRRALEHPDGVDADHDDDALAVIANAAGGDARRALTDLEHAVHTLRDGQRLDKAHVVEALGKRAVRYDRAGDNHYDVISAFIKSMRGSDPDAAIYWLARMLEGGEDPRFIARRLVIFASEDVGNADPRALSVAVAAADAARHIGMPEVRIVLAQATTWLAAAPKSNASYVAIDKALEDVRAHGALPVPPYLRSRPPEGSPAYEYPHDAPNRVVGQPYLPERLRGRQYYEPVDHGEERVIRKRLDWWNQRR